MVLFFFCLVRVTKSTSLIAHIYMKRYVEVRTSKHTIQKINKSKKSFNFHNFMRFS